MGDAGRARALVAALQGLSNQTLVPLDDALVRVAIDLAAVAQLRGADAAYATVARQYGTTLVTLDRQQSDWLSPLVRTALPASILAGLETGA